jgi:ABC-type amino acid transport substrate-binding protein
MSAETKPTRSDSMRIAMLAISLLAFATGADAAVLDRARDSGELRIGYRANAQPFSFKDANGKAAGYSVDLCRAIARETAAELGGKEIKVVEVEVSATDRFDALQGDKIDLLCEATTVTLARRAQLDFTLPTFATGATLLYPADGPTKFDQLAGKKVGVLSGSTTEPALREALETAKIAAEVVGVPDHRDGIQRLAAGEFAAYFGDGAILMYQLLQSPFRDRLRVSDKMLSFEPYALALPKGDEAFRLVADWALAKLSRSGQIGAVFEGNFGDGAKPSDLIKAMWILNSIPD